MEKYILIEADYNDGDHVSSKNKITDEEIELIQPMLEALIKNNGEYPTGEMSTEKNSAESIYKDILNFSFFDEFVPYGEYGIHTITHVEIIQLIKKLF